MSTYEDARKHAKVADEVLNLLIQLNHQVCIPEIAYEKIKTFFASIENDEEKIKLIFDESSFSEQKQILANQRVSFFNPKKAEEVRGAYLHYCSRRFQISVYRGDIISTLFYHKNFEALKVILDICPVEQRPNLLWSNDTLRGNNRGQIVEGAVCDLCLDKLVDSLEISGRLNADYLDTHQGSDNSVITKKRILEAYHYIIRSIYDPMNRQSAFDQISSNPQKIALDKLANAYQSKLGGPQLHREISKILLRNLHTIVQRHDLEGVKNCFVHCEPHSLFNVTHEIYSDIKEIICDDRINQESYHITKLLALALRQYKASVAKYLLDLCPPEKRFYYLWSVISKHKSTIKLTCLRDLASLLEASSSSNESYFPSSVAPNLQLSRKMILDVYQKTFASVYQKNISKPLIEQLNSNELNVKSVLDTLAGTNKPSDAELTKIIRNVYYLFHYRDMSLLASDNYRTLEFILGVALTLIGILFFVSIILLSTGTPPGVMMFAGLFIASGLGMALFMGLWPILEVGIERFTNSSHARSKAAVDSKILEARGKAYKATIYNPVFVDPRVQNESGADDQESTDDQSSMESSNKH